MIPLFGRDHSLHERYQLVVEERVKGTVVDSPRLSIDDLDVYESDPLKFFDEVTLRQSPGYSTGPGRWVRQHFGRQSVLLNCDIRYAKTSPRLEHACTFG